MEVGAEAIARAGEGAEVPTWLDAVALSLPAVEALSAGPSVGPSATLASLSGLPAGSVAAGRFPRGPRHGLRQAREPGAIAKDRRQKTEDMTKLLFPNKLADPLGMELLEL